MDNTTRLYEQLTIYMHDEQQQCPSSSYSIANLHNKFQGIFDIKEVKEYKAAVNAESYTPAQFLHLTNAMQHAFIEGYLLAQAEADRKTIKYLYNSYKQETECLQTKKDVKTS